ncbi:unnamed protein product [marine sediment metagenome]|uniref:Uncharacterized protein n=1 Tax=marine sediment metagenome TaxID=412755 RepID=X1RNJ7_9ZZZZ
MEPPYDLLTKKYAISVPEHCTTSVRAIQDIADLCSRISALCFEPKLVDGKAKVLEYLEAAKLDIRRELAGNSKRKEAFEYALVSLGEASGFANADDLSAAGATLITTGVDLENIIILEAAHCVCSAMKES